MNKNAKVWLTIACVAVLLAGAVFGTLAYFTDSESATNTFTVGEVGITLDESNESTPDADDRTTTGNAYHLLPGHSYVKDPTVTVEEGSSESYVRMMVTVSNVDALEDAFPAYVADGVFLLENLVTGWNSEIWQYVGCEDGTYEFRYHTTVDGNVENGRELEPLFTNVVIPGETTKELIANIDALEIDVTAHAIQAAGFDTADLAWAAFAQQHPVS